ncbi:unnamed protein product [Spodoptera littoralis]|uniref:Regulatory protein zeste n=1 Tax=Spodoptera littoralis TaxID=7109 RepID=A0A9P0HY89_SPOLI|nr:unnamed protein product [Spodoptera littoralis]CAH1636179.1 unnamed protein product [Spodoptera littoralis]
MAEQQNIKAKPLVKDSIILLLDMIMKYPVITTKATNATNNKLKEEAWKSIAQEFSAVTGDLRRPEQIRLKWENLKKSARKRSAFIRQNNLKTGGGKSFIPPDDVLDRVASILGSTCNGLPAEFGGDADEAIASKAAEAIVEVFDFQPLPEIVQDSSVVVLGGDCGGNGGGGDCGGNGGTYTPKNYIFNTPKSAMNKRRKLSEEVQRAQRDKDLGLATYFQAKAQKVILENKKIELENIKLELEIKLMKQKINCND